MAPSPQQNWPRDVRGPTVTERELDEEETTSGISPNVSKLTRGQKLLSDITLPLRVFEAGCATRIDPTDL
jgi:hypothetical protein